jgi:hypothetical protein
MVPRSGFIRRQVMVNRLFVGSTLHIMQERSDLRIWLKKDFKTDFSYAKLQTD